MIALFIIGLILLSGCVTPYKEVSGKYIKAVQAEVRSPFGTNQAFSRLERCDGPQLVVAFYLEGDFTNCVLLTKAEQDEWVTGWSQGQGGQVVSGLVNAAALGGVAAAAGSSASTTSSTVINNVVPAVKSHGHK